VESAYYNIIGYPLQDFHRAQYVRGNLVRLGFPRWVDDIVTQIPCELFFFGSRTKMFIEPTNTESDWDFALDNRHPDLPKIKQIAFELGFRSKAKHYPYQDGMTFEVWELKTPEGTIQLVFKVDIMRFHDMWACIPEWFYRKYFYKKSPDYMGKEYVTKTMAMLYDLHSVATHVRIEDWE